MASETLREFLVSLGYKVDASSEKRFTASLDGTLKAALKVGAAVAAMAVAIQAAVVASARSLEDLYFASQRAGASAENFRAFGYAVSQMGGSVAGANSTLENFGRLLRENPGTRGMLASLGINVSAGRDATAMLADLGRAFQRMQPHVAAAYGAQLGIDERTRLAITADPDQLTRHSGRQREVTRSLGMDFASATENARNLMVQVRDLGMVIETVLLKAVSDLMSAGFDRELRSLGDFLVANGPQISTAISNIARAIIWLVRKLVEFGTEGIPKIVQFAEQIDKAAQAVGGWEAALKGVLAFAAGAWAVGMLAAIGRVSTAAGAAMVALTPPGWLLALMGTLWPSAANSGEQADMANRAEGRPVQPGPVPMRPDGTPQPAPQGWWQRNAIPWMQRHGWQFRDDREPRGIRNNNPLNLESRDGQPGRVGSDGRFGIYGSMEAGIAQAARQLLIYQDRYNRRTVAEIIGRWAPSNENNTGAYVARVAQALGVDPNAPINLRDPTRMSALVGIMAQVETGRSLGADVVNRGVRAGLDVPGQLTANTQITINGAGDPAAVGREVASQQQRVNADLLRNSRAAVQ